jgi:hypothetical protein
MFIIVPVFLTEGELGMSILFHAIQPSTTPDREIAIELNPWSAALSSPAS